MSHPTKDQWDRQMEYIRRLVDKLQDAGPALFQRDRETGQCDGFPASSLGGDGRGGSEGSSTENAALADHRHDVIHDDAVACRTNVDLGIEHLLNAVRNTQHAASKSTDHIADHGPGGTCLACLREVKGTSVDRIRSGYCPACYRAWLRDGKPDRLRFERARRQEAA